MIGRTRELDALEEALTTALAGELQIVLVEGEAGVGKSSLLRAFRDAHQDISTLAWAGDETETQLAQTAQWSLQPSNLRQGGRVRKPDAVKDERAGDRRAKRR